MVVFIVVVVVVVVVIIIIIIIIIFFFIIIFFWLPLVTGLRSRFLGGKDSFLKCFKQPFFGIVYCQKFPIIARIIIIIIIIIVIKNDWPKKIKT